MLHRIVAIAQRPPEKQRSAARTAVEVFKRALFVAPASELKVEIRKVLQSSASPIAIMGPGGLRTLRVRLDSALDVFDHGSAPEGSYLSI